MSDITVVPDRPDDIADLADGDELPESELDLDQSPNPFPGSPA